MAHPLIRKPDLDGLLRAALFNPNDLHLDREGRHCDTDETEVRHLTAAPFADLRPEAEGGRSCDHHGGLTGGQYDHD